MAKKKATKKKTRATASKRTAKGARTEAPATKRRRPRADSKTNATSAAKHADGFPIVGIGASAGGLGALGRLLDAMPDEPGVALVIVQHLEPTKKSLAPELLSRHTKMPVAQVEDDPHVKPNHVYVIPPGKYMSISRGTLHLSEPDRPRASRMAIDFFLRSLAEDQKHRAVGVLLSGAGTDGTLGVKAIKVAGGLVIVQDPATAEHGSMPRSAIETGIVDHILALEQIPEVLVRYAQHGYVREGAGATPAEDEQQRDLPPTREGLEAIISLLGAHSKHAFRSYKEKTLVRRTRRRMCLYHCDDYAEYLKYLRDHPQEIDALTKDLLITVTDFFREPEAWEELRRLAVRPMVKEKHADEPIRVWTPGCATGEEPYSVAMLILEELKRAEKNCPLNVFASDIEPDAIEYARLGRYPRSIEADVSRARLKQFFTGDESEDYYQVSKSLRESVVLADQDLIADPPFSKLDLVCCRNLLMYLKPDVQEKVIALFHFALREGGTLFLGSAETVGRQTDLFETLHKRWRIFRRIGPTRHDRVGIPIADSGRRRRVVPAPGQPQRRDTRLSHLAQQRLLDVLAPAAVLIDRAWRILYLCGDIDPYLTHKPGIPSDDLLEKARRGLRSKLRVAVQRALSESRTVSVTARVQRGAAQHAVVVTVRVVHDREDDEALALVVFEEQDTTTARGRVAVSEGRGRKSKQAKEVGARSGAPRTQQDDADLDDHAVIRQLEDELAATKDDLQTTVEQLETSNEEFKAANEEMMSINEELQSTNEELETSKEELQSLNEELSTVNHELASKVEELETKHADLENLIAATEVATICLDTNLTVRWFTPAAQQVVRLKPGDKGRALADLAQDFADGDLVKIAERVLNKLTPVEDEARCRDGRTLLRRVTPYCDADNRIGGVVMMFVDITRRKQDEHKLRDAKELSDNLIDLMRESALVLSGELYVLRADQTFYDTFQVSPAETEGRLVYDLGNGQWDIPELRRLLEEELPKSHVLTDFVVDHHFETIGRRVMVLNARWLAERQQILLAIEDVTDLLFARETLERDLAGMTRLHDLAGQVVRQGDLQAMLDQILEAAIDLTDADKGNIQLLDARSRTVRIRAQRGFDAPFLEFFDSVSADDSASCCAETLRQGQRQLVSDVESSRFYTHESRRVMLDAEVRAVQSTPLVSRSGQVLGIVSTHWRRPHESAERELRLMDLLARQAADLIERAQKQVTLRESEKRFRSIFDTAAVGIAQLSPKGRFLRANATLCRMLGYEHDELDALTFRDVIHPDDLATTDAEIQRLRTNRADTFSMEHRKRRKDDSTFWVYLTVSAVRRPSGRLRHFVAIVQDIDQRKRAEEGFRRIYESNVIGIVFSNVDGTCTRANEAFCRLVGYTPEEVRSGAVSWRAITPPEYAHLDDEAVRQALEAGSCELFEKEYLHKDGHRIPVIIGAAMLSGSKSENVAFTLDLTRLKKAEAELKQLNESLEEQIGQRTEMLSILQDVTRAANEAQTVEEALRAALKRISEYNGWQVGHVWKMARDGTGEFVTSGIWYVTDEAERAIGRLSEFQQICAQTRFAFGEPLVGAVAQSGEPRWIDDITKSADWRRGDAKELGLHAAIAFPVTVRDQTVAVLEFFSDHPARREARFMEIMPAVGIQLGHVIERKRLESAVAEATTAMQRQFGRELHDSVSQELTGLRLISERLRQSLAESSSASAEEAAHLVEHLQELHMKIRRLSRGLMPVEVDAEGLRAALERLVNDSRELYHVACEFQSDDSVRVEDNNSATQLYRIAQEAIQNAAKHGSPNRIVVRLFTEGSNVVLQIEDDGVGFESTKRFDGSGQGIMQYRAGLIGATLLVESQKRKGTTVTCTLPDE